MGLYFPLGGVLMRRIAVLLLFCLPLLAAAQTKVRLSGVSVGAGATFGRAPLVYPYSYYPYFWDPWFPGAYSPGAFWPGFAYAPDRGEVKLQTADARSEVFIDGALAGTAEKLKSIWLQPGAYTLAVQPPGKPVAERRIYVLTGKTLRVKL